MKRAILLLFAMFLIIAGCTEDSPIEPENASLVVRGYIYANEPINDIQITTSLSLGSEETSAPPVNNAQVSLVRDGVAYDLVLSAGDSGYYHYPGDDLTVNSDDVFTIQVENNGEVTTGTTTVPTAPAAVEISNDEMVISTSFRPQPGQEADSSRYVEITWEEDASALFYVVVESTEENPDEIELFGGFGGGEMRIGRSFTFPPSSTSEFRLQMFSVQYYGSHVAKVYRVNQEYADLYESRNQDSRDLNEPLTNIENGLGVFSAFASTNVEFTVIAE
jgi:hypothetical protein